MVIYAIFSGNSFLRNSVHASVLNTPFNVKIFESSQIDEECKSIKEQTAWQYAKVGDVKWMSVLYRVRHSAFRPSKLDVPIRDYNVRIMGG